MFIPWASSTVPQGVGDLYLKPVAELPKSLAFPTQLLHGPFGMSTPQELFRYRIFL